MTIFKIKIVIIYACLELDGKMADISTDYHVFKVSSTGAQVFL